jgi:hypothetical protein
MGADFNHELDIAYGPVGPLPPLPNNYRRVPRPPLPIPHVARRGATPPPHRQPQHSAQAPAVAAPAIEAKPSVQIQPTQKMPAAQGLN